MAGEQQTADGGEASAGAGASGADASGAESPGGGEAQGGHVLYEVSDGVATITLNDPGTRNSLSVEMLTGLLDAFGRADADQEARCVVLASSRLRVLAVFCADSIRFCSAVMFSPRLRWATEDPVRPRQSLRIAVRLVCGERGLPVRMSWTAGAHRLRIISVGNASGSWLAASIGQ